MLEWHDASKEKPAYGVRVLVHTFCKKCAKDESHSHTCVYMPCNVNDFEVATYYQGEPNHPHERFRADHWSLSCLTHWAYIPTPKINDM